MPPDRVADGLFEAGCHGESREAVEELLCRYPNSDTKQPAERLKEKLRNRPWPADPRRDRPES
ncbi:MAG: hypothetical protein AMXMBFR22_31460 [Phycisphaerae bacterium]